MSDSVRACDSAQRAFIQKMQAILAETKGSPNPDKASLLFCTIDFILTVMYCCDRLYTPTIDNRWPVPRQFAFCQRKLNYRYLNKEFNVVLLSDSTCYYLLFEVSEVEYKFVFCQDINIPYFNEINIDALKISQIDSAFTTHIFSKLHVAFKKRINIEKDVINPNLKSISLPKLENTYGLNNMVSQFYGRLPPSLRNRKNVNQASMMINVICFCLEYKELVDFGSSKIKWDNSEYHFDRIDFKQNGFSLSLSIIEDTDHFYLLYWVYPHYLILEHKVSKELVPTFKRGIQNKFLDNTRFQLLIGFIGWSTQVLAKVAKSVLGSSSTRRSSTRSSSADISIPDFPAMIGSWEEYKRTHEIVDPVQNETGNSANIEPQPSGSGYSNMNISESVSGDRVGESDSD